MAKTLILCFDGTSNDPEQANDRNESITNVLKLHLLLGGDLKRKSAPDDTQMSFYFPGVGTYGGFFKKLKNMAFAPEEEDVGRIIKNACVKLHQHYAEGDQIVVFGYSRGAAIARRFCSVLPAIFKAISDAPCPNISLLGVFDTVASINKPNLLKEDIRPASDVVFENRDLSPIINKALHLVSSDDKRIPFYPTLMNRQSHITEVWFPGGHSDVGGGNQNHGLSDITLEFMMNWLQQEMPELKLKKPAEIDLERINLESDYDTELLPKDISIEPDELAEDHVLDRYLLTKATIGQRQGRVIVDETFSQFKPLIHHSVLERMVRVPDYQPYALVDAQRFNPYMGEKVGVKVWYSKENVVAFDSLKDALQAHAKGSAPLAVGESKQVSVQANRKFNRSGVLVQPGQSYEVQYDFADKWYDASIECAADGWDRDDIDSWRLKEWFIKLAEDDRRVSEAKWFELIATVGKRDERAMRFVNTNANQATITIAHEGQLYFFANDLLSKYGNNFGKIDVMVKRIA